MKTIKSKRIFKVLLFCSIVFANCTTSIPQSNVNPIKVAGTIWTKELVVNHWDYIVFNLDSTFVAYYGPIDEMIDGRYFVKDGRIILHQTIDDSLPKYDSDMSKDDLTYIIIDNQMCFVDEEGKVSKSSPYTPAPKGWTPPPMQ